MIGRGAMLLFAVGLTACEAPPVINGAEKVRNATLVGRIEGQVVVASRARGRVVVLLYDAARPPPPLGTGRPLSFTVVPKAALFSGAADGDSGPFLAPFAFSLVPPGQYLLRGLVDANDDFIPWYGVTADVNTGDVGGAAVDAATRAMKVVEVGTDEAGRPVPATGVVVSFADASRVPVDRPVFQAPGAALWGAMGLALTLSVRPISEGVVHQALPVFLAQLVDDNGDGVPDDTNGDGTPDFWPRVIVRKVSAEVPSRLVDENDLDKNGVVDETGVDHDGDGTPEVVVLAAGFDFTALLPQLLDSMGQVKRTPTPVTSLPLVVRPLALDAANPAAPRPLAAVPAGDYAVTVIQSSGQTWRLPNELSPPVASAVGLPALEDQAFCLRVP